MISASVEGRIPYMTYPEPWRGPTKQQQELFLVPAPKPLNNSRYNGVTTSSPNGTRLVPPLVQPSRPISKYPSPTSLPSIPVSPVNLTQKDDASDDLSHFHSPYRNMYPNPYFSYPLYPQQPQPYLLSRGYNLQPTPLSPMESFSPNIPTPSSTSTFLSPPSTFSPPSSMKPQQQTILRDKRTPPHTPTSTIQGHAIPFKVPSGKEGSLKHRILIRPEDQIRNGPLDLQKPPEGRRRLQATMSPPRSPKKTLNNNTIPGSFAKGSLIQLASGDLKKIEDMRTEDFIMSADNNPELRLAESTVVKIEENRLSGSATITLSYNQRQAQVEVESPLEHPYFVMGRGWASCNPERSQQCYGLSVHGLQVGDILISLTPRENHHHRQQQQQSHQQLSHHNNKAGGATIMTSATNTSMTSRMVTTTPNDRLSPDRKRRWSAPDDMCEEEQQQQQQLQLRRHRID
ncbi:unnamed protein product [Brassicogethes aeneus]|uniref:AXH domain-containing protein n=1 Tax=Brassicogethes aeneus TaxID=1431903 RepID=A0A9P0AQJ2_BRAAE|nr:unnamed protein product [Brassicogethes aeneus]